MDYSCDSSAGCTTACDTNTGFSSTCDPNTGFNITCNSNSSNNPACDSHPCYSSACDPEILPPPVTWMTNFADDSSVEYQRVNEPEVTKVHVVPTNFSHGQHSLAQFNQFVNVDDGEPTFVQPPARHSRQLGAIQILCGAACMIIGLCALVGLPSGTLVWHGIWGGVCSIIAGSLQVASTSTKKDAHCMTAAYLGMSIIAAASMAIIFVIAIISATVDNSNSLQLYSGRSPYFQTVVASDALQAVFSGLGCFFAIWAAGVGSQFCCGTDKYCWNFWCLGSCTKKDTAGSLKGMRTVTLEIQGQTEMN